MTDVEPIDTDTGPIDTDIEPIDSDDAELALARLEWARDAHCLDLPSQREALDWHLACLEAARSADGDLPAPSGSA